MANLSLTHYLIRCEREHGLDPELRLLLETVARACKTISHAVGQGALGGVLGGAGTTNIQGEAQKKLDVLSNEILVEANSWGGYLAGMASEEMDNPLGIPVAYPRGKYLLLFDPLDGSSNIDVNVSIGTIFSVLRAPSSDVEPDESSFLQPGSRQVCAGYTVYGPQTLLVLSVGYGVQIFTLARDTGSFVLTQENVRIPSDTREFAINMSNVRHWEPPVKALRRRDAGRHDRTARQGLQHALGRFHGGRRASHHVARRHLHVSARCARTRQARQAATDVRRKPDVVSGRGSRRRRHQRTPAHPRHPADDAA